MIINNIFHNPILLFTVCRYIGYGLQAIRSIYVAKILGPHLLGIWGFLMMVEKYLFMTSIGVPNAINLELSTIVSDEKEDKKAIIGNGFFIIIIVTGLLIAGSFLVKYSNISLFVTYKLDRYILALVLISVLNHFKQILINIYRLQGKLNKIIFSEMFLAISMLVMLFFYQNEALITALLVATMVSVSISIMVFIYNIPIPIRISIDYSIIKKIIFIGLPLIIYNFSFFLISLSARTIMSVYYSVEQMGFYSLANALGNISFLGVNAVIWALFPNILNKLKEGTGDEASFLTVRKINALYETSVYIIIYSIILLTPVIFNFLPKYKEADATLSILLLSQGFFSISFGYNSLAISRKKQKIVACTAMISCLVVVVFGLASSKLKLPYESIAIAVLVGSFVYANLQTIIGANILKLNKNGRLHWLKLMPIGKIVATIVTIIISVMGYTFYGGLVGFLIFVVTDIKRLLLLFDFVKNRFFGQSNIALSNYID